MEYALRRKTGLEDIFCLKVKLEETIRLKVDLEEIIRLKVDLEDILYQVEVLDHHHIKIKTTKDQLGNILKALLLNNIDIYELKKEVVSLEDIFLKTTKENNHDSLITSRT